MGKPVTTGRPHVQRDEVVKAVASTALTLGREISAAVLEIYWIAMEGLTVDEFELAIFRALNSCTSMPVPAKLKELAYGDFTSELN